MRCALCSIYISEDLRALMTGDSVINEQVLMHSSTHISGRRATNELAINNFQDRANNTDD